MSKREKRGNSEPKSNRGPTKYTSPKLEAIWSDKNTKKLRFEMWDAQMKILLTAHPKLGKMKKKWKRGPAEEHEVLADLAEYRMKTGAAFAHLGLCSSDIVE